MADPTSQLFWAKQIKREHGFIHKRTQGLEKTAANHEDRIKAVEKAVKSTPGADASAVEELAKKVQAAESGAINRRLDGMEKTMNEKVDNLEADTYSMTKVLDGLQQERQVAEEERKATLTKDKALLKRIGEVEECLKQYEKNLDLIGKRSNSAQVEQIKEQLAGLTRDLVEKGEQIDRFADSVAKIETAYQALVEYNEKLERKLKESEAKAAKAAKAVEEREARAAEKSATAGAEQSLSPESSRKKSHKWAGGGADRDIIKQGAELFGTKSSSKPSAPKPKLASDAPKKTVPKPVKKTPVVKKNPVPKASADGSSRKSHKWAGGGADRDIIAQGLSQASKRRPDQPRTNDTPTAKPQSKLLSKSQPQSQASKSQSSAKRYEGGKEVVRSGRGWFEVEYSTTPEPEADADLDALEASIEVKEPRPKAVPKRVKKPVEYNEDGTPIKRPRGRPRKYPRPEDSQSQSGTQSARSSLAPPVPNPTKKRSADSAFSFEVPDDSEPPAKRSKISTDDAKGSKTTEPSQAQRRVIYATHKAQENPYVGAPVAPVAQMAPSKPSRRQIVQLDDHDMETIIRRMHQ